MTGTLRYVGHASARDRLVAVFVVLSILSTPLALGQTGGVQASHLMLLVAVLLSFTRPMARDIPVVVPSAWILFAVYVLVSGAIWSSALGDWEPLQYAMAIPFGVAVLLTFLLEIRRDPVRILRIVKYSCFGALAAQVLAIGLQWPFGGQRGTLFYSNPNQLAYFAVLAGSIVCACHQTKEDGRALWVWLTLLLMFMLTVFSASKAGLLGFLALASVAIGRQKRARPLTLATVAVAVVVGGPLLFDLAMTWGTAIFTFGQVDDSLAGRGYDRFWRFPQYLILGGGEGVFQRFSGMYDVEIHSTIGSLLFSYGIVGASLAVVAILMTVERSFVGLLYLAPAMLYGVAHNGIRQPLLWVLAAIAVSYQFVAASKERGAFSRAVRSRDDR